MEQPMEAPVENSPVQEKETPVKVRKTTRGRNKKKEAIPAEHDESSEWKDDESVESESNSEEDDENIDDPIEILEAAISGDLSEDPVRLYLKEIGRIDLLDADSEFRLAARIEAERLLDNILVNGKVAKKSILPWLIIYTNPGKI